MFWSDAGLPAAIYRRTDDFRTILMSIPFETISETAQAAAMNQVAGWLGDLGDSTVLADQTVGSVGEMRTFTITARNDSQGYTNNATVTNVLPEALQIDAGSITGGAVYQAATRTLTWSGSLADGAAHQISYRAIIAPDTPVGTTIENVVHFYYARHNLTYEQVGTIGVGSPYFGRSAITAVTNTPFAATAVTYTVNLYNSGTAAANGITATITFPEPLHVDAGSITADTGTTDLDDMSVIWQGDLTANSSTTLTVVLTRTAGTRRLWYPTALILQEETTGTTLIEHRLALRPFERFFPFAAQN